MSYELDSGDVIVSWNSSERITEYRSATGVPKGTLRIIKHDGTTLTVRGLRWYERAYKWIVDYFK